MTLKTGTPGENTLCEARVAMTPDSAIQLQKLGYACLIEMGAVKTAGFFEDDPTGPDIPVLKTLQKGHPNVLRRCQDGRKRPNSCGLLVPAGSFDEMSK